MYILINLKIYLNTVQFFSFEITNANEYFMTQSFFFTILDQVIAMITKIVLRSKMVSVTAKGFEETRMLQKLGQPK